MAKITGVVPPEPHGKFAPVPGPDGITLERGAPVDPDPCDP